MKKSSKKYLQICISLLLILSILTACGKTKPVWEPTNSNTTEITTEEITTEEVTTETSTTETTTETVTESTTKATTVTTTESITKLPTTTKPKPTEPQIELTLLQKAVKNSAEKYGAVAIQAAVISNGKITETEEYGWAVLNQRKMTEDTKIRVASLSKTVVAMVAFKLIENSQLDLNADISEYIGVPVRNPAYPDDAMAC